MPTSDSSAGANFFLSKAQLMWHIPCIGTNVHFITRIAESKVPVDLLVPAKRNFGSSRHGLGTLIGWWGDAESRPIPRDRIL
ncbi:hypothetical protein CPSG_06581 [Coccidioides posadasii str. Silveira]|uniref:Uncharacterized protein n=1 Tax=Coccidioides posadasii (strain RMSCC 757 / Silveira) TaxID=443226 RepID=E9D9P1_COCPS|nr:hypothetical protein CPSG_06581 [Coccidioides posadasii str. Silveira]